MATDDSNEDGDDDGDADGNDDDIDDDDSDTDNADDGDDGDGYDDDDADDGGQSDCSKTWMEDHGHPICCGVIDKPPDAQGTALLLLSGNYNGFKGRFR